MSAANEDCLHELVSMETQESASAPGSYSQCSMGRMLQAQ